MKKLNITDKQYSESKYFTEKYGSLKYVSESGNVFKTDKGVVLALESEKKDDDDEKKKEDEEPKGGDEKGNDEEELTVKKEDLASALQGVIDTVKDIAADNDVVLPEDEEEEEEKGEDDEDEDEDSPSDKLEKIEGEFEFDEGGEDICPTCGQKCKKCADECGDGVSECGGKKMPKFESVKRAARVRRIRESMMRRARAKKVLESIRRRRMARKVLESIRRRRALKKMMESRKAVHPRRVKMAESAKRRPSLRMRRIEK